MKLPLILKPLLGLLLLLPVLVSAQATKTITIKGSNADPGDTIVVDESAEVDVSVTATGIVLTLPSLDVRTKCLGDATSDGYCFIAAGGNPAATSDNDMDGVPDANDSCPSTTFGQLTDRFGCSNAQQDDDNDGVPNGADQCASTAPNAVVDSFGCSDDQQDGDNDGVLNTSDLCPNTPSNESANSDGCSPSQLDSDNDGVTDNIDQCPNTAANATVNSDGCSADQLGGSSGYCVGTPTNVLCEASVTLDSIYSDAAEQRGITIPPGGTRSLPFETTTNTSNYGLFFYTSNESFTGYSARIWFSNTPGGAPINSNAACDRLMDINPGDVYWSQDPAITGSIVCPLSSASQVYYVNHSIVCNGSNPGICSGSSLYPTTIRFDVGRNAAPL